MKNLLEFILAHLVDYPEDVVVTQSGDENHLVFNIQANNADYGRIIGKNGSMISSIRNIMTVRAIKEHVRVTVIVDSGEKTAAPVASAETPNMSAPVVAETATEAETAAPDTDTTIYE